MLPLEGSESLHDFPVPHESVNFSRPILGSHEDLFDLFELKGGTHSPIVVELLQSDVRSACFMAGVLNLFASVQSPVEDYLKALA